MRVYAPEQDISGGADDDTTPILGSHVDANLLTLLWSDQPGLEVRVFVRPRPRSQA
jgi:isopenicillin N synthase-like dioxygenase